MGKFISMKKKTANKAEAEAFAEFIRFWKAKNLAEATVNFLLGGVFKCLASLAYDLKKL